MKVGLVLEGGAMRGLYSAGVLDTFLDEKIDVDVVVGVSAGVLFGVNFVSKQRGRALRYNKQFIGQKNYMSWHSLLTTGNIVNKEFAFYDLPFNIDVFDQETFGASKTAFYATLTNMQTGSAEYRKIHNVLTEMEVLRASSAMPFMSEIIELDGQKYLDGGVADSIPIEFCKSLGCDKIIVVLTRPLSYRKKPSRLFPYKLAYRKYPNFIKTASQRYKIYNETVEKIGEMEKDGQVFVVRPSRTVKIKRLEKDKQKMQEMYNLGLSDAQAMMANLKNYLVEVPEN